MVMTTNDRHQAAEQLKNMMMAEKPSIWPKLLAALVILGLIGGAGYWFYLPLDKRPPVDQLKDRAANVVRNLVNTPIMGAAQKPAPSAPTQPAPPAESADNLISSH